MNALIANSNNYKRSGEPLWVTNEEDPRRVPVATRPFIFSCGCSKVKVRTNSLLNELDMRKTVDIVKITASRSAQRFVELHGLKDVCPALKKHEYGVLCNPKTMALLDLMSDEYDQIKMKFIKTIRGET